ncbi:MAG: hypothetical protein DSZ24_07065, partial [Thermodesulfatator sp.]
MKVTHLRKFFREEIQVKWNEGSEASQGKGAFFLRGLMYKGKVKEILKLDKDGEYFKLKIACPELVKCLRPGHFVRIKAWKRSYDPLLPRPFAIFETDGESSFTILFKVQPALGDPLSP